MIRPLLFAASIGLTGVAFGNGYLSIGDSAPALAHAIWVKGEPVRAFDPKQLYVVEFWATWCEPCKENIPNLTALAHKYQGRLTITGVSIWESTDHQDAGYLKRVNAFVTSEGDKMDYTVAADDLAGDTANSWMKAAGEGGIPMSFVVKDGKIAWIGHAQGLDDVLSQITAGTYDLAAAKSRRELEVEAIRPVQEAMQARQFAKALTLMSQIVAKRPNMDRYYQYNRYVATAHLDLDRTKAMSNSIITDSNGEIGAYQMMCSVYASEKDLSQPAYAYGMTLVKLALAKKDREYMFLSMAGAVSESLHHHDKAVEFAEEAVAAAEKDPHAPAPFVEFLKRNVQALTSTSGTG
jgi:thiol-disulfide isomerase/thioredoxin